MDSHPGAAPVAPARCLKARAPSCVFKLFSSNLSSFIVAKALVVNMLGGLLITQMNAPGGTRTRDRWHSK
ncbi:unnamed protein product, partial [Brenthis ino]